MNLAGEPVEQLRMCRQLSLTAEVLLRSRTMPRPKCMRQIRFTTTRAASGCVAIGQPAREAKAIARLTGRKRRQAAGRLARDDGAGCVVGAASEEMRRTRRRHLLHHHDLGNVGDQPVLLLAQGFELGERRDVRLMLPREEVRERGGVARDRVEWSRTLPPRSGRRRRPAGRRSGRS